VMVSMVMRVRMVMAVVVLMQVDVDTCSVNAVLCIASGCDMEVVGKVQFCQFRFEKGFIDTEVEHGGEIHVTADAGKTVVVEDAHSVGLQVKNVQCVSACLFSKSPFFV
jgi:hypothetical protein